MKKVPCANKDCSERRLHWCYPDKNRPHQMVEVPDDYEGKAYCSLTCQAAGEKINVWTGKKHG